MKKILATIALSISITSICAAQINLCPDILYTATLGADENMHLYKLELETNQLVCGQVMQLDVDVELMVVDPDNHLINIFDSPNGEYGPENFFFRTGKAGMYELRISALKKGKEGKYKIEVQNPQKIAFGSSQQADQLLNTIFKPGQPGMIVSVMKEGKLIYQNGIGKSNLENNIVITPQSPFHIASISKQFTGYGILKLAAKNKLALDDHIQSILKDFPEYDSPITIGNLLYHTSGITDQWKLYQENGGNMGDTISQSELYHLIKSRKKLEFTPGTKFQYSNSNYLLLAEVIKKVTNQPFDLWMRENVFADAEMNDTQVKIKLPDKSGASHSYALVGDTITCLPLNYKNYGATNIQSSAVDLIKWMAYLDQLYHQPENKMRDFFNKGTFVTQISPTDSLFYGAGINILTYRGQQLISHAGADAGYRASFEYYPDLRSGIVLLSNLSSLDDGYLAEVIADIFFGEKLTPSQMLPVPAID